VKPSDLAHLVVPEDPQLHPDGERIAYVLVEIDLDDDRYHRTVHLWDGERNRRFTAGPSDTSPRWSPDGRWLAFLRKGTDEDAHTQLMVMPLDGGEARPRTDLPLGVSDLAWAPDSAQLVVVGAEWRPGLADLDDDERRRRPRRITRLPYRSDAGGWLCDRQEHLWLVDVAGDAEPRRLTTGDRNHAAPVWRPDGAAVAFVSDPEDFPDTEPHDQAYELDLATSQVRPLGPPGSWSWVGYDPAGAPHLVGLKDALAWPDVYRIYRLEAGDDPATATLHDLTGHTDRNVVPPSPGVIDPAPRFVEGGIVTALEGRGTSGVVRVELEGWRPGTTPEVTEMVGGPRAVTGLSVRSDGGALAITVSDPASPGELVWCVEGRERCLTDLTRGLRARIDLRPTQRFTVHRDGVELDAWAVLPEGFDDAPPRSVPVLLNVHGGPASQYGEHFFDEFQVEAGAGYLAVGCNPHGSSGRGVAFARSVVGAWQEEDSVDTLDLEAAVDAVLARFPQADPARVGIMGGSYGGYATARLLARNDRFRSAVVERGLLAWESFSGTSDIGPWFDREFLGASLRDGAAPHHAASPTRTAHRITTPTLVLHSEHDWRCPIEQGEQFFVALRHAGVESELVRFPDEGHELTRSGQPRHRVDRFEIVLDWHGRHLG
jgi:dipeptidyl aminopeptidase/acylaminoacyl peptidase